MATALDRSDRARPDRPAIGPSILATLVALVSGYMAYRSLSFPFRPRLGPLAFASLTFVLALAVLVLEIVDLRRFVRGVRTVEGAADVPEGTDVPPPAGMADARTTPREWMAFGWLLALVVCFFVLGFMVGMTLFMLLMMRLYGRERWSTSLVVTGGVMVATYVLFVRILNVRVYDGMFDLSFLPF